MNAYLEKQGDLWLDDFVYKSVSPLNDLGVKVIPFDGTLELDKHIESWKRDYISGNYKKRCDLHGTFDILIGSVEATIAYFEAIDIPVPKYLGYPEELTEFLGRNITKMEFGELPKSLNDFPYFIKPVDGVKLFTGSLVEKLSHLDLVKRYMGKTELPDDTLVYVSEPKEFVSEYRCFVHKGELKGLKQYLGDYTVFPDVRVIYDIIKAYSTSPVAYTIDVGITDDRNTLLVEINDMWAIGSYGLDGETYVRMVIDRFKEILKR